MDDQLTRRTLLCGAAAATAWAHASAWAQSSVERGPVYNVSVVPQFPPTELHRDWTPLLERVARDSGMALSLKLTATIPRFEADLLAGHPDFVYLNPYHMVMAMRAQGYTPLLRDAKALTGILVVRRDDPIKSVRELDGKELAFPAPNAFGASLWMRALLAEREGLRITPSYVQTHSNVYRQVIRGRVAAGGGVNHTLIQESAEVRSDLRVLLETPPAAPHPLAVHPRVPIAVREAVTEALLRLVGDPQGQALLKEVALPAPLRADYARDYRLLEQYKLDKYVVMDKPA